MSASATPESVIRQIVEAMRALAGPHPGFRPVHAKGLVCTGTFRASADAPRVTRAPHFAGQSVPTIVQVRQFQREPRGARWCPERPLHGGQVSAPRRQERRYPCQLRRRVRRTDTRGAARVPARSAAGAGHGPPRPGRGSALSRRPSRRARLRRAPDEEGQCRLAMRRRPTMPSTPSASPPPMVRADSAAIDSCRRQARPFFPRRCR